MVVRPVDEPEVDHLAQLWYQGWRDAHEQIVPTELTRRRTLESFRKRLEQGLPSVRVIGPSGAALGFYMTKGDELYQLYISRDARGSGVAAALIADAEARLGAAGVATAWLACAIGNERAARFYEKCGWRRVGTFVSELETPEGTLPLEVWRYEKSLNTTRRTMWYYRKLPDGLVVLHTRSEHAPQLEELQRICFPTLADAERFKAEHYRAHLELFPDGQLVVLDRDTVVGATTTLRLDFDFDHVTHTFADIIQGGWLRSHQPDGEWLYGADIGVRPEYRGRGLATALYAARQEVVWRLGLKGQVTAGMMRDYGAVKHRVTADEYYRDVIARRVTDSTLSMQIGVGFEPKALLENYLNDPSCDNYSVLLVLGAEKDVRGASRKQAKSYIRLNTEIPGPRARAMLARRAAAVPAGLARATDVVVERADDGLVFDIDGNTLIDLAGGIGMLAVGHCHPMVVKAVQDQAAKYVHPCALVTTYEPYVRLAELLNELTPGTFPKKTILANSGAEAVENAVKLARKYTGRPAIICFEGGYHGRTLLTLSLTSKYGLFKSGFGPFAPEIVRLPVPDLYRRPDGLTEDQYLDLTLRQLDKALVAQVDPTAVAAMIVEPVQGEAGFVPVPRRFLQRVRELCTAHGIVMIADEVQCGLGRTGRLFAIEHYDIVPDLVAMAKSLGGGLPVSAVTGRAEILDAAHWGGVGSTFGGSPVACAAAIEAVSIIRQPEFLAHARRLGEAMREVMDGWTRTYPIVGDVRGLGPMMLAEFVRDRVSKGPLPPDEALQIVREAGARGVLLMRAGLYSNCIRLLPPLTIPESMLREGLAAVEGAIEAACVNRVDLSRVD